jgi:hypothetical protein
MEVNRHGKGYAEIDCSLGKLEMVERRSAERARMVSWNNPRKGRLRIMAHLTRGLQDTSFLLKFEGTSDPWERSKLVGQRISELRESFMKMSEPERVELAKSAETELRTGLELLGKDKKTIRELIAIVDPPTA